MDLRFLFLDLNSYFASVEQQLKPDLRGEPVIVVPVMTDATCAIAASYEAKAFGIKTGTNVGEAKRICPRLKIVEADHKLYVEFHHRIHAAMEECLPAPIVASIDEFGGELLANERSPEQARRIALAIKAKLKERVGHHVRASIGIAPNRYLAKVACDMQKPDGLTVLEARDIDRRLRMLSLRDLPGIGPNMEVRLHRAGVHNMNDLLALAPKHMRSIWGSVGGEILYHRLRGVEIADPPTTKSTVGHSHVLAPKWRPEPMAFMVAQRLTLKAGSRLRREDHLARAMDLSVRLENGAGYGFRVQFEPSCDNHRFLHALRSMWEDLQREVKPVGLKKVSVTLHGLVAAQAQQPTLFTAMDAGNPQRPARLATLSRAMDAVNAKYGRDTVVMGFLPRESTLFSGTKVAFSRVPQVEEFHE